MAQLTRLGLYGGPRKVYPGFSPAAATAAITGTVTSATEADIISGGKTLIITLTNDTWAASGAAFNAVRQDIIDGLDAAASPALGWNDEVRDKEVVGAVVRTSDTVVTITLTASPLYDITANETITVTVPASALVTSAIDVTAAPTFSVSGVSSESGVRRGRPKTVRLSELQIKDRQSTADFIKSHLATQRGLDEERAAKPTPVSYKASKKSKARRGQERIEAEAMQAMQIEAESEQRIIRANNAIIAIIIASDT